MSASRTPRLTREVSTKGKEEAFRTDSTMHRVSTDEYSLLEWSQLFFVRDEFCRGCVNDDAGKSIRLTRIAVEDYLFLYYSLAITPRSTYIRYLGLYRR